MLCKVSMPYTAQLIIKSYSARSIISHISRKSHYDAHHQRTHTRHKIVLDHGIVHHGIIHHGIVLHDGIVLYSKVCELYGEECEPTSLVKE